MAALLPRLPGPAAEAIVRRFLEQGPLTWTGFNPRELPEAVRFAATGGSPINDQQLRDVRLQLVDLASRHGYRPNKTGRAAFDRFDAEAATWLAQEPIFSTGEALRDDVWSFIGAVLAPDIAHWRFGTAIPRYLGGVRNTFQRLWMRGRALDRSVDHPDRWILLEELTEDALVQITERPSIGGDPVLALAVGEAWLRAARHYGRSSMESIMRGAILRVRIRNEVRNLSELPVGELSHLLDGFFGTPISGSAETRVGEPLDPGAYTSQRAVNEEHSSSVAIGDDDTGAPFEETLGRIRTEAERRGWLSPKSHSALDELASGGSSLETSQWNALSYLLGRMTDAQILKIEVEQTMKAMSARAGSDVPNTSESPKARRSRWAIWRAR